MGAAILATAPTWAAWTAFGEDESKAIWYFDPDSIRTTGVLREAWAMKDMVEPEIDFDLSKLLLIEVVCQGRRQRLLQHQSYRPGRMGGGGEMMFGNRMAIAPGTGGRSLSKVVCNGRLSAKSCGPGDGTGAVPQVQSALMGRPTSAAPRHAARLARADAVTSQHADALKIVAADLGCPMDAACIGNEASGHAMLYTDRQSNEGTRCACTLASPYGQQCQAKAAVASLLACFTTNSRQEPA